MRKALNFGVALVALVAFVAAPMTSFACDKGKSASADKTAEARMIGDKHACAAGAKQANAAMHCPAGSVEACVAKLGISPEDCQKVCASGEYTLVSMNVKGMTCGSCEQKVSAGLTAVPGVVHVGKVSAADGTAYVVVDPKKVDNQALVSAVTATGYTAEVIPAVATEKTDAVVTPATAGSHNCSPAEKAACAAKGTPCPAMKKAAEQEKKAADPTEGSH